MDGGLMLQNFKFYTVGIKHRLDSIQLSSTL